MNTREIGKMIYSLRIKKNISLEDLCRGICSITTLHRLEVGERRPDILEFQAIYQRLGRTADQVGMVLTLEEFEYFMKRRNVEISMTLKEYERAERELKILEQEEGNTNLKRQDIHRQFAMLYLLWKEEYQMAKEYVFRAIIQTIPDVQEDISIFRESLLGRLWLSEIESGLLLLYAYLKEKTEGKGRELFECVWDYTKLKVAEQEAREKREAQIRYFLAKIKKKEEQWAACYEDCEAVILAQAKYGTIRLIPQMLSTEISCLEHGVAHKKQELRKKQYKILEEIMKEYGIDIEEEIPVFLIQNEISEKLLLDELIHYSRIRKKVSQEELSEDICTSETLSRIETGKRNPTIKHFYELMQKLGLEIGYYNTYFEAEKFETLEKGRELRRLIVLGKFKEAEEKLQEIEKEIDGTKIKNRQYLAFNHAVLEHEFYQGDLQEVFRKVEQALELTLEKEEERFRIYYQPTQIEISLLNQLAALYRKIENQKEAVKILKPLYEYYHRGKLQGRERDRGYFMILGNLASCTEEIDELSHAMKYAEEFVEESLKAARGNMLGRSLMTKGYIQERMSREICLKTYEQAYYMCGLFDDLRNQRVVEKHVKESWRIIYEI